MLEEKCIKQMKNSYFIVAYSISLIAFWLDNYAQGQTA